MIKIKTGKNTIMSAILIISVLATTLVYSAFSTKLQINGEAVLRSMNEIRITAIKAISYTSGVYETYNNKYTKDTINIYSTLPAKSNITYEITIKNSGTLDYIIESINELTNNNPNVTITTDIKNGDVINKNSSKVFTITLNNSTETEQKITIYNQYKFKAIIQEYSVEVLGGTYYIGSTNEKIPVLISNNNPYTISGNITYDGKVLYNNFTIPANTEYSMIHVPIDESIYNSLTEGVENKLSISITSPAEKNYNDKIIFVKKTLPVSIINVTSNTGTVSFTQDTINIDNNLTSEKNKAEYSITLRNNVTGVYYKFRNITQEVSNNIDFSYNSSINLADGIVIYGDDEYSFNLSYNYDESKDNSHKDILRFVFKEDESYGFSSKNLISLGLLQTSNGNDYGDFSVIQPGAVTDAQYKNYYSDNGGKYQYDSNGGLVLDSNNPIGILNIDQSMSINDEYSIHLTVKGNTNQKGADGRFPGTIIAVSQSNGGYLSWIGFFKNYLHVYSYNSEYSKQYVDYASTDTGFISYNISEHSDKIVNITVTAIRGGSTKLYINGELKSTFASGVNEVKYTSATLGDLRPGRNLKFNGTVYELLFYNRALSETEVKTNWNNTNSTWHIK